MLGVRLLTTTTPVAMPTLTCWGTRVFSRNDSRDQFKSGPHRLLGVVFMSMRISEVNQDTVSHILSDSSAKLAHGFFGASRIGRKDVSQILRVHPGGERRRPDQISEHHRHLTAFGLFGPTRSS